MKEFNMYVRGIIKNIDLEQYRKGFWITVLEYNNFHKVLKGTDLSDSNVRSVVIGIKRFKEPCFVNLYIHALFLKMSKVDRKVNVILQRAGQMKI